MNQHKDLLYRQKYATTNLTIARFQRKIRNFRLARSQSVHIFSGTYCKKKRGGGSHTINYYGKSGDSRTPDPRQGLYTRNCNGRNYTSYHSDDHLEGPYLLKTRELPGAPPPGPRQGLCPCTPPGALRRAPGPHRMRRALTRARCRYRARIFPPTPFLQILDPPLYTSPLARPSRLPPEASILGELGSSRPPPMKIYRFAPPPIISST